MHLRSNEALLPTAPLSEAAGSLRSLAASVIAAPQQNAVRYAASTFQRMPITRLVPLLCLQSTLVTLQPQCAQLRERSGLVPLTSR
jgi:hypothetical protein